jgi:formylglycine-generating enzyme required for sulfatase activity
VLRCAQQSHHPVVGVSREDAQAFIDWLNAKLNLTGRTDCYRLPTETEWEYACRANTNGTAGEPAYAWGPDIESRANYKDSGLDSPSRERALTTPVGCYPPNRFGLCDMHGNVNEWVDGRPSADALAAMMSAGNKIDPGVDGILRGGSWYSGPSGLRAAARRFASSQERDNFTFGFRLARTHVDG